MKKILFLCMLCLLTLGANAQTRKRTAAAGKKTQTTVGFKNENDFYQWIEGKTFVYNDKEDPHKFVFKGFWNAATNKPTGSGKVTDNNMELSDPDSWSITSGKAESYWPEFGQFNNTIIINKAKKTLSIELNGGITMVCPLVESSASNEDFIKKELAKYIKNGRNNPNVILSQKAKADLEDCSWPEVQCKKYGDLGDLGANLVVKKIGTNAYRYECKCCCDQETYVDNWTINAVYSNGKVKINSFTVK